MFTAIGIAVLAMFLSFVQILMKWMHLPGEIDISFISSVAMLMSYVASGIIILVYCFLENGKFSWTPREGWSVTSYFFVWRLLLFIGPLVVLLSVENLEGRMIGVLIWLVAIGYDRYITVKTFESTLWEVRFWND